MIRKSKAFFASDKPFSSLSLEILANQFSFTNSNPELQINMRKDDKSY